MKRISLDVLFKKLSIITAGMTSEVKENFVNLPKEKLEWQPNERTWSIAQCLEHLNAYYRYYIPVFKGKITNSRFNEPPEYFTSSPLGRAVYRSVRLGKVKNVKRKLKSLKEYNPLINSSLKSENPVEEYLQHQEEFLELLKMAREIDMRKTKCALSVRPVVKLNIGDALLYMAFHNERHIHQALNVLHTIKS